MSQSYLDIAQQGRNSWWRYLLGIFFILFFWQIVGSVIAIIFACLIILVSDPLSQSALDSQELQRQLQAQFQVFWKNPSVGAYTTVNIPSIFFGLAIFLVVAFLHQRSLHTLISADNSVNLNRLLKGFFVWFMVSVIPLPLDYFINSGNYIFSFNPSQWFLLLPIALVLTPIQTSAEEFFFRGYLLQGLGLITRHRFVLIFVSSILFAVPHFYNPEMQRGPVWIALGYLGFGVFLTLITLKDNRLELALGVHAANNLQVLIFNTKDSALPAPSIWVVNDPGDPRLGLVVFLVQSAIFYYVIFGNINRKKQGLLQEK